MPCKPRANRLAALALVAAASGGAASAQTPPEDLRLRISLPAIEAAAAPWSVRPAPDGRLIVDLPFDRWTSRPRLTAGDAGLDAGQGPDGRARLIVTPSPAAELTSAALRPTRDGARLTLMLRERPQAPASRPAVPHPAPPPPVPRDAALERPLVVIDPGHGGIDPGAVVGGVREKDLVDAFAADLAAALRASGRWRVAFTREGDRFMRLDERWRRADAMGAAVLLSIHANTVARGIAEGATVFTRAEFGGSARARALARLENQGAYAGADRAALSAPPERRALTALARRVTLADSRVAGDGLAYALSLATPMLRGRAHEQAAFRVLRSAHTPSALIELGFLTHPDDLARMQDPGWRARTAGALTAGLETWRARAAALSSDPARRYAPTPGDDRVAARKAQRE